MTEAKYKMMELPIEKIKPSKDNPRKTFDPEKLQTLAESIKEIDLMEEISVRSTGNGSYEVINGERRYRAEKALGVESLRVKVYDVDEIKALVMRLSDESEPIERGQREAAIVKLMESGRWTNQLGLSKAINGSDARVSEILKAAEERKKFAREFSTRDLARTRPLEKIDPKARQEILNAREKQSLSQDEADELTQQAKAITSPQVREQYVNEYIEIKEEAKELEQQAKKQAERRAQRDEAAEAIGAPSSKEVETDMRKIAWDNRMVKTMQEVYLHSLNIRTDHLKEVDDPAKREQCLSIVLKVYNRCKDILTEMEWL
jgi:ParB family chromosome partitioning protein